MIRCNWHYISVRWAVRATEDSVESHLYLFATRKTQNMGLVFSTDILRGISLGVSGISCKNPCSSPIQCLKMEDA